MDGSRVNVAVRPIGVDGPLVSIRKFSKKPFNLNKLVEVGAIRPQMAEVLAATVKARVTLIISGGTGSGKTTMLNALRVHLEKERLLTIEDAAELQCSSRMWDGWRPVRPTSRQGEIRQRELVKNALRMRPDRIILGECRGEEAFDMLQAMNTGHEGSMATIHANTPRDAHLAPRADDRHGRPADDRGVDPRPDRRRHPGHRAAFALVRRQAQGHLDRRDHRAQGDIVQMQEIFKFVRTGTAPDGTVIGHFQATGVRPRFADLSQHGHQDPRQLFRSVATALIGHVVRA